MSQEQKKQLFV